MTFPPIPQTEIPLEPMREGKPPKRRLKDAMSAQTLVANMWQASQQRNLRNASYQGMFDGNPPYNPTKMRAAGRSGDANFNTLAGKALLSTMLVPYYDLFAGATHYVEIKTRAGTLDQQQTWSRKLSDAFDRMLRRWKDFNYQMQSLLRDFGAFGKGYAMFDDTQSWRWQKIAQYRVLVPDATTIDLDRLELLVVLQDWRVHELYKMIKDPEQARSLGWNPEQVKLAIEGAVPVDPAVPNDPIAAQAMLRDNDLYTSARSSTIQTATIFVREFSGKWSQAIMFRDIPQPVPQAPGSTPVTDFLFYKEDKYDAATEFISPFFFEVLDGSWNGASGLAKDIFVQMQLLDRLSCAQANAVFLRNSLVLQPRTALDKSRLGIMQVGAVTWIPDGVDVVQSTILGDIAATVEMTREINSVIERNTGIYRPTLERQKGNPATLGEFQMKFTQATVLASSAVDRFYDQLDRLYSEMCRRAFKKPVGNEEWAKEARRMQEELERDGVPPEAIAQIESVRAWRNIGNGSAGLRQQTLQNFMGLYPLLPANGQLRLLEDVVAVSGSQAQVERYVMPDEVRANLPTDQQELAMLENAALKIGAPVTWTPSQNNLIHLQVHLLGGAEAANSLQQGANPVEVLGFLDMVGQHAGVHIQRESQNPTSKQALQMLVQQWKQLGTVADKLRVQVQAQAEQQAQLQQQAAMQMTDEVLKEREIQGKLALSREKAFGTLALKKERQDAELLLKAQKQDLENSLADASTAADIQRDNAKVMADLQRDAVTTEKSA